MALLTSLIILAAMIYLTLHRQPPPQSSFKAIPIRKSTEKDPTSVRRRND